jgi:putative SOS response-associated peptidase YedK
MHMVFGDNCAATAPRLLRPDDSVCTLDHRKGRPLLAPYPSDEMICWPVSARVGNVRNNDSSLIEPVAAA